MTHMRGSGAEAAMITVRFFAGLREQLGRDTLELPATVTSVREVWARATDAAAMPTHLLAAVNLEYADFDAPVADGDEVAFFPPVTGGAP
jgi:molybdopterin synthase sulfur carrier subunit